MTGTAGIALRDELLDDAGSFGAFDHVGASAMLDPHDTHVAWLAAYALGLAVSGHGFDEATRELAHAAGSPQQLDQAGVRLAGLALGDQAIRRQALRLLRAAAATLTAPVRQVGTRGVKDGPVAVAGAEGP